jgi:hypothetical protein
MSDFETWRVPLGVFAVRALVTRPMINVLTIEREFETGLFTSKLLRTTCTRCRT